ncbi:hypothetical protein Rcae01_06242 [Novipirellula caenicola]|uniref:Uncharacterized protein n=1 Tax=Novipirellula caenicola TaxID=1536901 RepID=A0ABP9W026_9BACT
MSDSGPGSLGKLCRLSAFYSSATQEAVVEQKIKNRFKNDARHADNAFSSDPPSFRPKWSGNGIVAVCMVELRIPVEIRCV